MSVFTYIKFAITPTSVLGFAWSTYYYKTLLESISTERTDKSKECPLYSMLPTFNKLDEFRQRRLEEQFLRILRVELEEQKNRQISFSFYMFHFINSRIFIVYLFSFVEKLKFFMSLKIQFKIF